MHDPEGNEFCVLTPYPPELRTRWLAQYDAYVRPPPERRLRIVRDEESTMETV